VNYAVIDSSYRLNRKIRQKDDCGREYRRGPEQMNLRISDVIKFVDYTAEIITAAAYQ